MTTDVRHRADERGSRATRPSIRERISKEIKRITFERSLAPRHCVHPADEVQPAAPSALACPGCDRDGTPWVQLRMCLACGSVGCCDTSPGRHAVGHFETTGHPLMRSIEPGDTWGWCYVDSAYITMGDAA